MKRNIISIDVAKQWVLHKIQNGNDALLDFVWIQNNLREMTDFFDLVNCVTNNPDCLQRRNKVLITWLTESPVSYEEFLEIVEQYYCDMEHPKDLDLFIPYMPRNEKYPPLSPDTFKQRCDLYLQKQ